jgi:hypothetical protein
MSINGRLWSVPVSVDDISESGSHYELTADEPTRQSIAREANLRDLPQLDAVFDLTRRGDGIAAKGEVRARVGQTCVVTLEPIESEVREAVDLVFVPDGEFAAAIKRGTEPPEPLADGTIDLGVVSTEFLMLGLDPYPRKPGAAFASTPTEKRGESPFAPLARLKKHS